MPSISDCFSPASAIASSAALLMRSSEDEPSCLPYDVSPTPVMKIMAVCFSIRLRQTQHLLGDKTENELRADRRDARDQGFPQITLDVIFLGVTEAAMRHDSLLAGVEAGFRCEIFRSIGGRAALHALIVLPACAQHHHPRSFQLHPVLRQRVLNALIHADRAIE